MCGIFGFVGDIDVGNEEGKNQATNLLRMIRALFYYSETRGTHASGFSFATNDRVMMEKAPMRGGLLAYNSKTLDSLIHHSGPARFIAHTRYGTGSNPKINTNNHPFVGSRFNMVHNGTIQSWYNFAKDNGLQLDSETDSEVILRFIERKNEADVPSLIEEALIRLWGNMAVALLDKTSPDIWLFRNDNPISVFECPAGIFGPGVFYFFASTVIIFEDAIKNVFKRTELYPLKPLGIQNTFLDVNKPYRLTTKPVELNGKPESFIAYNVWVNRPYYRQTSWTNSSAPPLPKVESFPTNKTHNAVCIRNNDGRLSMVMTGDEDVNLRRPEDRVDGLSRANHALMQDISKSILAADEELSDMIRSLDKAVPAPILVEAMVD